MKTRKSIAIACIALLTAYFFIPQQAVFASESHVEQVIEKDLTYEGFMENDEMLTFEEIASLPGANVVAEYDSLLNLKVTPVSKLFEYGLSQDQVEILKTKSIKELVLDNAATYPYEVLKEKGLTDFAIQAIKDGDYDLVTTSEARDASAHLALGIGGIYRSGNALNFNIYWHWDNSWPWNHYTDTLLASISNGYNIIGGTTAKIGLANSLSMTLVDETHILPVGKTSPNVTYFELPMQYPPPMGDMWIISGKAFIATKDGSSGPVYLYSEYFHAWFPVEISITGAHISFPVASGDLTTANFTTN